MLASLRDAGYEVIDSFYTSTHWEMMTVLGVAKLLPRLLLSLVSRDLSVRALGGSSLLVLAGCGLDE